MIITQLPPSTSGPSARTRLTYVMQLLSLVFLLFVSLIRIKVILFTSHLNSILN